ncbi:hypothetical protein Bca52824_054112 [Brassica carinata]|uniref:Uncharacterized protein n=1 Tax=Brassica carinata TaxID=52824 RepID=A0A8X7R7A1_BRACI|nr:hypothetical protein Bca52824_054112 [Brassica carinata]
MFVGTLQKQRTYVVKEWVGAPARHANNFLGEMSDGTTWLGRRNLHITCGNPIHISFIRIQRMCNKLDLRNGLITMDTRTLRVRTRRQSTL